MFQSRWIVGVVLAFLAVAWMLTALISGIGSTLFEEWKLVFQQVRSGGTFWGMLLLAAGCVATLTALFRYEQQLISLRLGLILLTLRLGLVLVIFLTLLQPVWSWSYEKTRRQRLLIAMDISQSMETVDQQASDVEKIRWAEAIGMMGSETARRQAREWIADLQAGREPVWVAPREEADFARRKLLGQVRQENLRSQLHEVSQLSRLELARRAWTSHPDSPLTRLGELTVLELVAFAERFLAVEPETLRSPEQLAGLDVGRGHSHLEQAAEATSQTRTDIPLAGLVVLSDGRETDTPEMQKLLTRMTGLGVPVHTVFVGSEHRPRDLSIVHVDAPESVFLKDRPLVKCIVRTAGFEGESFRLFLDDLDDPDAPPLERTVTPQAGTSEVSFSLRELPEGRHRYRVRAEIAPRETREDNNFEEFSINVVDDRARVLLVDGESRWEFRFLNAALSRDEQISVDQVLFEQPFLNVLSRPFFPVSFQQLPTAEAEGAAGGQAALSPFAPYDLVLIGDVSPQNLPAQIWQQLDRYVREEGGTLVLTAGKRFFPMAYHGALIDSLLPVENLRQIRTEEQGATTSPATRGFHLTISPDGEQLPMFQLDTDEARSRQIWSRLPGHSWGIVGTARGGASVWATAKLPQENGALEQERKNGLIVQQYLGTGQVVWVGIESTWRWRYLMGDRYHHRFWGQFMRWAVSFKAAAGNSIVRLGLREAVIRQGQPAQVQARWDQRFLARHPDLTVQALLERQGTGPPVSQQIELIPRSGNRLIYEAQALGLPAGEYRVRLQATPVDPLQELPETTLIVNAELTPELQDVSANRALLEQISSATGGKFLYLNELNQLPELFAGQIQTEKVREEIPLYSHWLILVIFSTLAMTEWVLRKLNGLP